ncbi:Hypothetical predicted protein [Mytilus galloprovincialis]|uniref:Uncharacterized protein n=1 Tax=Mytilus galloprovincialis TaxID=29158 RepID=A0A8B6BF22_MYTGA|nr:Hypothetical predicted protein [Mytilus galloprovincialis]
MSQWLCDRAGTYNCPDHSDEDPEFCKQQSCPEFDGWDGWNGWRKCRDGKQCFNVMGLCNDERPYCKDKSEQDPDFCKNQTCSEGYIKCRDGNECFPLWGLCDGGSRRGTWFNCNDWSDEDPVFCRVHECANDYVKCRDGIQCINRKHLCDGTKCILKIDCADNSDEDPEFCKYMTKSMSFQVTQRNIHEELKKVQQKFL